MSEELIGVVTVTYNSTSVLREFLDSLASQNYRNFVLYVVDNASADGTLQILEAYDQFRVKILANESNLGVAEANNQGIRQAVEDGCEFILLVNNDTVFGATLLSLLRNGFDSPGCTMTCPKIYFHCRPDVIWAAGGTFEMWMGRSAHIGEGQRDKGQFNRHRQVSYVPTTCVLVHKAVFEKIGLLDPSYFLYWEDTDFMYRALKSKSAIWYIPEAVLWHKVSSLTSASGSKLTMRFAVRNRVYFVRKFLQPAASWFWIRLYLVYLWGRFLSGKDSRDTWQWKRKAWVEGKELVVMR